MAGNATTRLPPITLSSLVNRAQIPVFLQFKPAEASLLGLSANEFLVPNLAMSAAGSGAVSAPGLAADRVSVGSSESAGDAARNHRRSTSSNTSQSSEGAAAAWVAAALAPSAAVHAHPQPAAEDLGAAATPGGMVGLAPPQSAAAPGQPPRAVSPVSVASSNSSGSNSAVAAQKPAAKSKTSLFKSRPKPGDVKSRASSASTASSASAASQSTSRASSASSSATATSSAASTVLSQQIQRSLRVAAQLWWEESHPVRSRISSADPTDVSVRDIQRQGLSALMLSCLPLCYFIVHLLQEQTIENLFFLIDVENFRQYPFSSIDACRHSAQELYALYLAPNAYFEVNVSHQIRKAVIQGIREGSNRCYASAFDHVADLLNDAYQRFRQSNWWKVMSNTLGSWTIMHDHATVTEALHYIRARLPKEVSADQDRIYPVLAIRARLDMLLEERLTRFHQRSTIEEAT
ncbi:G-protein signaling regulator protein [Polyrhizophydium stewartii]|uniref:G-protein signaling regulator protein n=1 Tax=Polyrhizophydium stewartii TaxID=2732419 RepID=A0ABR4NBM3_9FUNG